MAHEDDQLIQTANGLWIPRQTRFSRNQQDPEPVQNWKAHWEAQGQVWRREPEIDQKRQQFLQQRLKIQPDDKQNIYPFQEISLTRADLEWLIQGHKEKSVGDVKQRQGLNLHKAISGSIDCTLLPLERANFKSAKLEGADFKFAQLEGADFKFAQLEGADFRYAKLEGANFRDAQLEGADFRDAQLEGVDFKWAHLKGAGFELAQLRNVHFRFVWWEGANFYSVQWEGADFEFAHLEGADFRYAQLEGADFKCAHLEGAYFEHAQLKGADFSYTQLENAHFRYAQLEGADFKWAHLKGAHFEHAQLEGADFEYTMMVTSQGIGPMVADVTGWDERSLPLREWSAVKLLGDEAKAKKRRDSQGKVKDATTRFEEYFAATRAYRQVATAVEGMGRKEEAEKFAFRAQVMQRKMHWWSIWQRKRAFWQRLGDLWAWVFSGVLALLSGYGYRFGRSFSWYIGILLSFAWLYIHLSQSVPLHSTLPDHLSWLDACILSVSDMVGRGFFRQDVTLSDPYAGWSVLEGLIGVFMDVVLISTLTQRLFKK